MGKFGHRKYFSAIKSGALPLALFFALLPSAFASHISDCDANFAKISQLALERPSAESWDKTVGAAWETALRELQIPQAGVVIEVAPGDRAKVGIGLAGIDFHGTLYVVEPSGPALQRVVEKYKEILPNAKIIPVEKTLQDALPSLPKNADALLANHPIDDMILADRLDSLVSGKIFDNVRAAFENVEKAWQAIALDKKGLAAAQENTTNLWLHAVDTLKPRGLGISQYESGVLQKYKVFTPDQAAQAVVQKLKSHFGENDPLLSDRLARHRMQPERWIVAQLKKNNSGIPEVVNRMGPKLFVTADAEPLEKPFASPLFAQEPNSHPEKFALRITNNPKGKTVKVYVDRQVDPLRIAMNGNEGSGRAAYIRIDGTDINLKGLGRTPLAVSKDKDHSDGALDLPNAIWELLGSNLVHSNFRTSASPVVALFDRGDFVQQSWNEFPIRGAVVARKDLEGSLDRPSHLFAKGDPVPKSKILHMARRFGEQDAEKYIERIVHGAWSAGNISNSGHMIDFDSIAALKGRAAHFTLTGKYVGNQFGGEGLGQLKLLDSIIDHPINVDKATAQEVHEAFWKARQEMLVSRFPDLIGIPPAKAGNLLYYRKGEVENLVTDFENLGRYMYPNYRSMAADNERADSLSVFDLSKFMRLYPLLKAQGKDTPENLLSLLMNKGGSLEPVENKYVSQEVKAQLHALGAVVDSPEKLSQVEAEAKLFIEKYRKFLGSLEREDGDNISSQELAMQAYRANEDRYYLNYQEETNFVEDLSKAYQDKRITPQRMGRVLKLLEESNNRLPIPDGAQGALSDIRIFREGWTARRLNTDGTFREVMGVFQDELPSFNKGTKLSLDSSSLQPAKSEHSGELLFESNPRPFVELTTAAQSKVKVNGGDLKWHLFGGD